MLAVGPVTAEGHVEIVPLPIYSPPAHKVGALARDADHVPLKDKTPASQVQPVPSSGFDRLQLSLRSFLILQGLGPLDEDDESRAEEALLAAEQDRAQAQAALRRNQAGTLVTLIQVAEGLYVAPPQIDIVV